MRLRDTRAVATHPLSRHPNSVLPFGLVSGQEKEMVSPPSQAPNRDAKRPKIRDSGSCSCRSNLVASHKRPAPFIAGDDALTRQVPCQRQGTLRRSRRHATPGGIIPAVRAQKRSVRAPVSSWRRDPVPRCDRSRGARSARKRPPAGPPPESRTSPRRTRIAPTVPSLPLCFVLRCAN